MSDPRPAVLIGFAEAVAAIESAWSLVDAGYRVGAFTRRGGRPPLRFDPDVEVHEVTAPEDDTAGCVEEVQALVHRRGADALMPLDDAALWIAARVAGARVVGPAGEAAEVALDKRPQLAAAQAAGFAVPSTWTGAAHEARRAAEEILPWPVAVRPALAAREAAGRLGRAPAGICVDAHELERLLARVPAQEPLIVQPWVHGSGEGLVGLASRGCAAAPSAHRRLRMLNPRGSGSSACEAAPVAPADARCAEALLRDLGWHGLYMIELLRERNGKAWFVEFNGRAWGSMALARRRGLEYPAWAAALALDPSFAAPESVPAGGAVRARHLGRDLRHLAGVLRDRPPEPLRTPGRLRSAAAVLNPRGGHLYNHRSGRRRVLLADTLRSLRP